MGNRLHRQPFQHGRIELDHVTILQLVRHVELRNLRFDQHLGFCHLPVDRYLRMQRLGFVNTVPPLLGHLLFNVVDLVDIEVGNKRRLLYGSHFCGLSLLGTGCLLGVMARHALRMGHAGPGAHLAQHGEFLEANVAIVLAALVADGKYFCLRKLLVFAARITAFRPRWRTIQSRPVGCGVGNKPSQLAQELAFVCLCHALPIQSFEMRAAVCVLAVSV